jgi:gluconolactonase
MFYLNTPKVRELEVWSSMPVQFRKTGVRSVWADANQGGKAIDSFLEGPVFDSAGNLYVTDIPFGRIFKIDPQGAWSLVAEYDGEPNGMKFLDAINQPDTLLITDYKNGLITLDVNTGKATPFLARRNTESFKGVNDLTIAKNGDIYFTDQGQTGLHDPTGRVYRYAPQSGKLDLLLGNVPSPNGIVLSPDEKFLFVACTRGNCVWRMPLQQDGSVSKTGQFFTSYGTSGPDGLAMDVGGRLLVANPGLGYVWVINPRGEVDEVLHAPKVDGKLAAVSLTNLAFGADDGGEGNQNIYCTDSSNGRILMARMDVSGVSVQPPPR